MKNIKPLLLGLLACTLIFSSCKKEQGCIDDNANNYSTSAEEDDGSCTYTIKGCTDVNSTNYNPDANVSDGNCEYEGSIVFWYNQSTSAALVNYGAKSLVYYIDGNIIGSSATSVYFNAGPACGATGSVGATGALTGKYESVTYSVVDDNGTELWGGDITLVANQCMVWELEI